MEKEKVMELFYKICRQAKDGRVSINNRFSNIAFNTVSDNIRIVGHPDFPTINIRNEEEFFSVLTNYVLYAEKLYVNDPLFLNHNWSKEDRISLIIAQTWANASFEDFYDPIDFLRKRHDYLYYLLPDINTEISEFGTLESQNLKESILMETPYSYSSMIKSTTNSQDSYLLPRIGYGLDYDTYTCYVYYIQNLGNSTDTDYEKMIRRKLFKINKGVKKVESTEYLEYEGKNNSLEKDYPENISDVTPSAILALTIFIEALKKVNIKNLCIVPFLPIRYYAKEMAFSIKSEVENIPYNPLEKEQERIQANVTNRFIRSFRRLDYHLERIKLQSYPDDASGIMKFLVENQKEPNKTNIISKISREIFEYFHEERNLKH